ncbi:MAG: M28 family peptidase [Candidatus Dadabacteria bacterium]
MLNRLLICFLLVSCTVAKKSTTSEDAVVLSNLHKHIEYLASDKLEGRRTGTAGEKLAAVYISEDFKNEGLKPAGTEGYLQNFQVNEGKQVNSTTFFTIDGKNLQLNTDFYPLTFSANATVEGLPSIALQEKGLPWFFDVEDLLEQNASNPHFDLYSAVLTKAKAAQAKGATAFIIYNTSKADDGLTFQATDRTAALNIPVVYVTKAAARNYLKDPSAMVDMKLRTDIGPKIRTGSNVIGMIDNGATTTVVLGAHFDHLGLGEDRNSLYTGVQPQIHNGADDNASGTAALMELARLLKGSAAKNNNYLFIAFSGEEEGLYGSKYFTEHPTVPLNTINYMINMDMVGRLNDSTSVVTLGGYGTSPEWGQLFSSTTSNKVFTDHLNFRFDSSGTGPSDHMSFYLKNIPVLFYFTGLHKDYHKPTDDADKINYTGELNIIKHINDLVQTIDRNKTKLAFAKTRDTQASTTARFSVTLGIMPDYTYSGEGVRVDGVSENRPAEKAGLKVGDVVIGLGDIKINSMESYMQALGKFKKGDKTVVKFIRGNQTLSSSVEF